MSSVLPDGVREFSTQGVDQDLVLVKLQYSIGKPPFPLKRFSVAVGAGLWLLLRYKRRVGGSRWKGQSSSLDNADNQKAGLGSSTLSLAARAGSIWKSLDRG